MAKHVNYYNKCEKFVHIRHWILKTWYSRFSYYDNLHILPLKLGLLGSKNTYGSMQIKKNEKIEKKFLTIFDSLGYPPWGAPNSAWGSNIRKCFYKDIYIHERDLHAKFHENRSSSFFCACSRFEKGE